MSELDGSIPELAMPDDIYGLYQQHYNYLVFVGLKSGMDLAGVKDNINQTFLSFLEKKTDFTKVSNVKSYILTSFKRKLIDTHRIEKKYKMEPLDDFTDTWSEPSTEENMLNAQSLEALKNKLSEIFETLPRRCQTVIFLKYYEGLNNEEIAERTSLTIRSVYNNLFEGIKRMREELNKQNFNPKDLNVFLTLIFV
ncbi:RNA polymerase sigma factor [Pedobacter caeni]|uniref:RNA polymerase sigma factor, sigma-70 family n=1 Tax=Pedobacter caeni TaxID=288992 RepID=A0A1M5LHR5_9SPHI|nr:sigma-70 family RNA polymerase sigma factor [Pedobacter caeni]SHG64571.1 RNA polymerase sigma factor, sigma-70 family [Pedobacter caeni]